MAEIPNQEIIKTNAGLLLKRWQRESLPTEKFEYPETAVELMVDSHHQPLSLISLMCANYETYKINGRKYPTLHRELIWHERGLRRGYVICHEEIPYRLVELQKATQKPINHLIVLVDQGMAETLFTPLNPRTQELNGVPLAEDIDQCLDQNTETIQKLLRHGLEAAGNSRQISTNVVRLTRLATKEFYDQWNNWNQLLRQSISQTNHAWGGMIRRDLTKDARYYAETWGLETQEALYKRVIDQQYGLTAVIGDQLHLLHNSVFNQSLTSKSDLILLDAIPGPANPAHSEFIAYNLDRPGGGGRLKTPILRPFYNLVLFSDPAIEPTYLNKSLEQMIEEANEF